MTRRSSALKTAALVVALLFGFALRGRAQSTEGYVDIVYDEFGDQMHVFAITYPDYGTLYYYVPHVHVWFMKEHDYQPINVWLGEDYGTGGTTFDYALASVFAPVEGGVPYSAFADHSIDIYFYDEWNYGWYDYYGYGLLELPYPWDLPRFEVWVWAAPIITAIQYFQTMVMGNTAKEAFFAPAPTLSCPGSVTRGASVNCTVSGVAEGQVLGWSFSGDNQSGNVSGPSGVKNWSGIMVQSGWVSVTLSAGLTAPEPKHITVNDRNFAFAAVSATQQSPGFDCGDAGVLSLVTEPASSSDAIGEYCLRQALSFVVSTIGSGSGPNSGFNYVSSVSNSSNDSTPIPTSFNWVLNAHLNARSGAFYTNQCGNWNGSTGIINRENLRADTIRHEAGASAESHYVNYRSAQNAPSNNLGTVAEKMVGTGSQSGFIQSVQTALNDKRNVIRSASAVEPYGVAFSEAGIFEGYVNYYPYPVQCN